MRSGTLALLLLTAACSAPDGVAGVSRIPAPMSATTPGVPTPGVSSAGVVPPPPPHEEPVLLGPPKVSAFTYVFPVKGCKVSYARKLLVLPKTTIWAPKGCAFVAPVKGVVREVNVKNQWSPSTDRGADREGRYVTVLGADGVLYLGGHLDSVTKGLRPGVKVRAGQTLGRVGNSGNARDTASNLYFAVSWATAPQNWWIKRGMVEPWDYLDAWWDGNPTLSPRAAVRAARKKLGALPPCKVQCASRPVSVDPKPKPKPTRKPDDPEVVVPF